MLLIKNSDIYENYKINKLNYGFFYILYYLKVSVNDYIL